MAASDPKVTIGDSVKITGFQYYWIIATGLLVGLIIAIWIGVTGQFSTNDPLLIIPLLAAYLYAAVAMFVVLLEMWDRFGLGVAVLVAIVAPAIIVYWFSRINGINEHGSTTDG